MDNSNIYDGCGLINYDGLKIPYKKNEVMELAKQFPLSYENVLYCYIDNKKDVEATRKELQKYVVKGH